MVTNFYKLICLTALSCYRFLSFSQHAGIGTATPVTSKPPVEGFVALTQADFGAAGQANESVDEANPFIGFNDYCSVGCKAWAPGYTANISPEPNSSNFFLIPVRIDTLFVRLKQLEK